jgi:mannose-6-phosphate isomerase-like protein (cupin superfamily)
MRLTGKVNKGWGHEDIFVTNDAYCGKFLHFEEGKKCSMHFHLNKMETWYILSGSFLLETIDTKTSTLMIHLLNQGDTWTNMPLVPHKVTCKEAGTILEVSTPDSVEDNYRIAPGDSQL